jgi:hypothetical protein
VQPCFGISSISLHGLLHCLIASGALQAGQVRPNKVRGYFLLRLILLPRKGLHGPSPIELQIGT